MTGRRFLTWKFIRNLSCSCVNFPHTHAIQFYIGKKAEINQAKEVKLASVSFRLLVKVELSGGEYTRVQPDYYFEGVTFFVKEF